MSEWDETGRDHLIGHWSRVQATFFLVAASLFLPSGAFAQSSGQGFLFKQPTVRVGILGGYMVAQASGDVLDHARDQLTLGGRDFDASTWGVEFAARGGKRFDVLLDFRFSRSEVRSEMRDWVDLDNLPIEQTTRFTRMPLTLSARFYLRDRGRAVSQFAWIPEKFAPFVGVGGGVTWYEFEQVGDFVDIETLDILNFTVKSNGAAPTAHAFAGVDISINPRFLWTLEGRYSFGNATTDYSFNYDQLNLRGFQATIGLSARF